MPAALDVYISVHLYIQHASQCLRLALTESRLVAAWLMPNDIQLNVRARFTFETTPIGDSDGVVHCEVLVADRPHLLRYSWKAGAQANSEFGGTLDRVYEAMTPGWGKRVG